MPISRATQHAQGGRGVEDVRSSTGAGCLALPSHIGLCGERGKKPKEIHC